MLLPHASQILRYARALIIQKTTSLIPHFGAPRLTGTLLDSVSKQHMSL
jgi:hypothetical protein